MNSRRGVQDVAIQMILTVIWYGSILTTKTVGGSLQAEVNHVQQFQRGIHIIPPGLWMDIKLPAEAQSDRYYRLSICLYRRRPHEALLISNNSDGNKLKDEDGLGLTITDSTGADYDHWKCIETKEHMKYTFGKDGYLRFDE